MEKCTGWAAVLAEIQCGRREIPADHPDAIRYGKRLESVEEFATRIAHLAASTQSETKRDDVLEEAAKRFEGGFTTLRGDVAALAASTLRGMKGSHVHR